MTFSIRGLLITVAVTLAAGGAFAQTGPGVQPKTLVPRLVAHPSVQQIQARRDYLFKVMLSRPDDLDVAFEYAALSAKVGDLEGAISTLERMLIFAPGLPRLQLELGVLYYRLSAFETARGYFEAAVSGPDVPPEVKANVERYLSRINQAVDPVRFTGQVRAGVRYQTNANRAPTDSVVFLNGLPFTLSPNSTGDDDGNVFTTGVFHVSRDLPSQGDSLEIDLVTYGSKQFEREELDIALAELTVGPAFDLARFGIDNAALGIYGIANAVVANGNWYSAGGGAGARFVVRPDPTLFLLTALEYRHKEYFNSSSAPVAELRTGDELRSYAIGNYIVAPDTVLTGTAYIQKNWARRGYYSYLEGGISGGPRYSFKSPLSSEMPKWTASLVGGAVWRKFDGPDPLVDPTEAERDTELFIGGGLTIPLKDNFALITELEYRNVSSNYDTRDYDNFSVSLSLAKGF